MIVVDRKRTRWTGTDSDWDRLGREVRERTCVHLPGFLDHRLLDEVRGLLEESVFARHRHGDLSIDERLQPGRLSALLTFVLNDPALLGLVERLVDAGPLHGFDGTVYRLVPGAGHFDSWHSDSGSNRRAAISINLNRDVVATAPLQIRRRDSDAIDYEFANAVPGDAVLFAVDDDHVHRIKPVDGVPARVACAGWFHSGKDIRARLDESAREDAAR